MRVKEINWVIVVGRIAVPLRLFCRTIFLTFINLRAMDRLLPNFDWRDQAQHQEKQQQN